MKIQNQILKESSRALQAKGYAHKLERIYIKWIKEYLLFHKNRDPKALGIVEIEKFKKDISLSRVVTHELKQQVNLAIFFLYENVLGINLKKEYIEAAQNIRYHKRSRKRKLRQTVMVF